MDVSIERPRFRSDLVAQPIEEEGVRYVDVTDPNSGATFRFYDVEYSIACAMDGARDLTALSEWTRAELGIETDIGELANVVNTLADLGYLEAARAAAQAAGNGTVQAVDEGEVSAEVEAAYDEVIAQRPAFERPSEPPPPAVEEPKAKPAVVDEMSFAGLMDDEGGRPAASPRPAAPPPIPAPRRVEARAMDADDEPTHIPAPAVEDDEDDAVPAIDLSAHLTVDREEVNDAVRSSRVMAAVEMPKGLDLEEEPTNVADRGGGTPPPPPEPMPLPAPPEGPRAIPLPSAPPPARAIEPTRQPQAAVAKRPAQQSSNSAIWLLVVLILVVGAGGVVYLMRDKLFGGDEPSVAKPKPTKPTQGGVTQPGKPVQAPPAPAAKLDEEAGSIDVISPGEGEIGWIVADGQQVESGEVIAKLEGADKFEKDRERATKNLEQAQARLEHYKTQNNPAKIAEKEGLVKAAQEAIAAADKELANLNVTAPRGGAVQLLAGKGAKVKAGDPVIRLGGDPSLVATFDVGSAAASYKLGSACVVAAQAARDKEYACVVEVVEGNKVSVRLVPGAAAAKGDAVVLIQKK